MNSVKIAYIAAMTVCELSFFAAALLAPIYLTPGYFWWSGICIIFMLAGGSGATKRMNSWGNLGRMDD